MRYENPGSSQGHTPECFDTVPQPPPQNKLCYEIANTGTFKKGEGDRVREESHPPFYENKKKNQDGKPLDTILTPVSK